MPLGVVGNFFSDSIWSARVLNPKPSVLEANTLPFNYMDGLEWLEKFVFIDNVGSYTELNNYTDHAY